MVALGIFDAKKREDICPSTHSMQVPNVERTEYVVSNYINYQSNLHSSHLSQTYFCFDGFISNILFK